MRRERCEEVELSYFEKVTDHDLYLGNLTEMLGDAEGQVLVYSSDVLGN